MRVSIGLCRRQTCRLTILCRFFSLVFSPTEDCGCTPQSRIARIGLDRASMPRLRGSKLFYLARSSIGPSHSRLESYKQFSIELAFSASPIEELHLCPRSRTSTSSPIENLDSNLDYQLIAFWSPVMPPLDTNPACRLHPTTQRWDSVDIPGRQSSTCRARRHFPSRE